MSCVKYVNIHPELLNVLVKIYKIRSYILNPNVQVDIENEVDQLMQINIYQDGRGESIIFKLDEIFGLHSEYRQNYKDQYQLLNTSFHDAIHLCLIKQLQHLSNEINDIKIVLNQKASQEDIKSKHRITRGVVVDTKLADFYNNYYTIFESYETDIANLAQKLSYLPISSKLSSDKIKINLEKDENIFNAIKEEFLITADYNKGNRVNKVTSVKEIVDTSACASSLATFLFKFANDIRFLSSGPRSGIGEMIVPENEPGSSIMPGKVNPTQCESLTMISAQVIGNHNTISIAASSGMFEGTKFLPLFSNNSIRSLVLLTDGLRSFRKNCLEGLDFIDSSIKKRYDNFII